MDDDLQLEGRAGALQLTATYKSGLSSLQVANIFSQKTGFCEMNLVSHTKLYSVGQANGS